MLMACPHLATKLPKTATNCCRSYSRRTPKRQQSCRKRRLCSILSSSTSSRTVEFRSLVHTGKMVPCSHTTREKTISGSAGQSVAGNGNMSPDGNATSRAECELRNGLFGMNNWHSGRKRLSIFILLVGKFFPSCAGENDDYIRRRDCRLLCIRDSNM